MLVFYWHKTAKLTFKFTLSSPEASKLLFFFLPQPLISTVRVKHITSKPCRSCSRLNCHSFLQKYYKEKFKGSLTDLARWDDVEFIVDCWRGLDPSLSQLILWGSSILGPWVSLYKRSAFALTFISFIAE